MMDLGPGFDEALLCPWKRPADTLNRIEGERRLEFLVSRMEVRPVMGNADFRKHADDDSKEPREFRHGRTLHRQRRSMRANVSVHQRPLRIASADVWCNAC